jgi:hypothetical protein
MLRRIIERVERTDNNLAGALVKTLYFNTIKLNRFVIFQFDLQKDFSGPSLDPDKYEIRILNYAELDRLIRNKQEDLPREFRMHEIHGVKQCVVVMKGNEIGHISWIYMKGDRNRWFDLSSDEAHVNYSFTFSDFRGKNFFPQALLASALWLKAQHFKRILMDVHEETTFMLNSMRKIKEVQRLGVLRQWCFYRPKFRRR